MKDKKEIIDQVIIDTGLKEKIDAAFSELEEQAKEKLITELESAVRKKLEKEYEKKAEELKKKAKKHMRKMLLATTFCACSACLLLNLDKITPVFSKKK